jgi:hypothetical protein
MAGSRVATPAADGNVTVADLVSFHVIVHARPAMAPAGPTIESAGRQVSTLALTPANLSAPLPVSFEQAGAALAALPRMYFEPDGSFVWRGEGDGRDRGDWQLDGVLYDRDGRVLFAEIKGACPPKQLDSLLTCLGWPGTQLVFQLAQQAVFLAEAEFRQFANKS